MTLSICAIQHAACEELGLIAQVLKRERIAVDCIRPFQGDRIPRRMEKYAGLVVMGGPMSVYEQDRYPFLRAEIGLIEQALAAEKPILGICLGSQLLASALGAKVSAGAKKEIGWKRVTLSKAAAADPLWAGVPASFTACHWHGDIFELPPRTVSLARSKQTACQAFRHGAAAYGILFHMEITRKIIKRMVQSFQTELEKAGLDGQEILDGTQEYLDPLQRIGETVFSRWGQLVSSLYFVAPGARMSK